MQSNSDIFCSLIFKVIIPFFTNYQLDTALTTILTSVGIWVPASECPQWIGKDDWNKW